MDKIKIALIRLVQACFFVFYLYVGLMYVGMVIVLPLGVYYHIYSLFHFLGVHGAIAGALALTMVAGGGYLLYQVKDLWQIILASGTKLTELGMGHIREIGDIANSIKAAMFKGAGAGPLPERSS